MSGFIARQVLYASEVIAKILRDNFSDIQSDLGDVHNQLDTMLTPPVGSEVPNARDLHTVLRNRLRSASKAQGNVLVTGGEVTEQAVPDMTVHIAAGEAIIDGIAVVWGAVDSGAISAPVSNTRLDYVVVDSSGAVQVVAGTPSATPIFPPVSTSQLALAAIVVKAATTELSEGAEIFKVKLGGWRFYPDVYVNSDTVLSENKNYNNLIVDGCKFDTNGFSALCQGIANLKDIDNDGLANTDEMSRSDSLSVLGTAGTRTVYNYSGQILSDIAGGSKAGVSTYYKASDSSTTNAKPLSICAYSIYVYGTVTCRGADGATASGTNSIAYGASGKDGGNGGDSGSVRLLAIYEISNQGTITTEGGDGGNGADCIGVDYANLGGAGGDAGDGGNVYMEASVIDSGTVVVSGGNVGVGGTGSGGTISANGNNGAAGAASAATEVVLDGTFAYPSGYASWMKEIGQ